MEKRHLNEYQEYQENKFTKRIVFKEEENVIFVLNFAPGAELPTHKHPGANVYILVLEGAGEVICDGQSSSVTKGDILHITGDEEFSYRGGEANSSLYVVLTKTPNENYAKNV
ncbi:cupin domain-containing protein [Paenibacillus lentus]|uniref:Cupin domain-containing protein n=1 Tax=Paenibacillus lentus TaxID=1338368 RepID=A0A3S8RTX6_9BACL|nr:cupin domain-containing protein [Paenibacillus lentus]AZK46364.1 cupin domain-containing protein [Paenibacillus lentus]